MAAEHSPEELEERGFVVSDKRQFKPSGEKVASTATPEPAEAEAPSSPVNEETADTAPPPAPKAESGASQGLPSVDFSSFMMMLTNNVMVFLGQVPSPITQQPQVDLEQAQHTIDIIMMLREKTRGNLTEEEERFLQELLPQLQNGLRTGQTRFRIRTLKRAGRGTGTNVARARGQPHRCRRGSGAPRFHRQGTVGERPRCAGADHTGGGAQGRCRIDSGG